MLQMGFSQEEIQDSLVNQKYNDVMATYLLLDYRNSEVHSSSTFIHYYWFVGGAFPSVTLFVCPHQLDEGCIKPRPGSDVSNINAPSPPHKVQ